MIRHSSRSYRILGALRLCAALVTALAIALAGAEAMANSGTATGRIMFYQNQGNFCPSTRDCTGALYTQSEFNTYQGVGHVKVFIRDAAANVIGQGATDAQGYFTISWYSPNWVGQGNLIWTFEHKDGRFAIRASQGETWVAWTYNINFVNAGTTNFGSLGWGSAGSPHQVANAYDGAWRTWYYAFSLSNRMNAYFNNLEVRAFHNNTTADGRTCPTSCAYGGDNRVYLDDAAAFAPQGRIMHEMGHIASYKASRDQSYAFGGDYTRDGSNGWTLTSAEYDAANFEEGLATFFGDGALYRPWATQPHTCLIAAAACPTGTFNIEASVGLGGTCATDEGRRAVSVDRFLWDAHDEVQDANYRQWVRNGLFSFVLSPAVEGSAHPYYSFFDTVHALDNGNADNQKDEPWSWNGSSWNITDRDGRSAYDLKVKFGQWRSDALDLQRSNNCSPGSAG